MTEKYGYEMARVQNDWLHWYHPVSPNIRRYLLIYAGIFACRNYFKKKKTAYAPFKNWLQIKNDVFRRVFYFYREFDKSDYS